MKIIAMLALAFAVACGGKKDDASATAGPSCTDAAHAAATALTAKAPAEQQAALADKAHQLEGVLVKHCTEDKWSADVITCYQTANGMMAMKACRTKLPQDQAQKLLADEIGVMSAGMGGGMGGMGGMGPHAGMGAAPSAPPPTAPANP